jgi:chemotaxis protein CheD
MKLSILEIVKQEGITTVGLGEMQVSADAGIVLACLGLGSCIGISAYDPVAHVGAMAHVVLPQGNDADCLRVPARYANSVLPFLVKQMEKKGALKKRLVLKIAGGAKIINNVPSKSLLDIGDRNVSALRSAAAENKMEIRAEDLMGRLGRSMWLHIDTGVTQVRTAVGPMREL